MKWYESWFGTPYYHKLYADRDDLEAALFMKKLTDFLQLSPKSKVLDMPCGKGRHALQLHELGYDVTGLDLSEQNISEASKHSKEGLRFLIGDMRKSIDEKFSAVFNLFTSIGYFGSRIENQLVFEAASKMLLSGGFFVVDFFNSHKVRANLKEHEVVVKGGVEFQIHRYVKEGFVFKNIRFVDQGKEYEFTERVCLLTYQDFKSYCNETELQLIHTFGDYKLKPFDVEESDRLIMIAKK